MNGNLEEFRRSQERQKRVELARKLREWTREFKERLREQKRKKLEEAINRHFQKLMTGHRLIDRIRLDEDFGLTYLDTQGRPIGMGNISAGMKQLVATALLWALREVSGVKLPVVIDTPLARLDRDHRANLVRHYYPCAAEQVILLPTDAEMERENYFLLKPYVYREYALQNETGETTVPRPDVSLYREEEVTV